MDTAQGHGNNILLGFRMFISATSPLVLCAYKFVICFLLIFKSVCASGWSVVRMENNGCTSNTNNYVLKVHFKNILEHLMLKTLKY